MRFNRRKKYKEMLLAQKEALLLQRRTRDLESRRRLLQVPVMIREPYVTSTKAATSPKGKSLFILPVSLKQDPHQLHLLIHVLLPRSIYQIEVSPCNGKGKKLTTIRNLLNCCLQITSLDYKQREGKGTCNETCSWRSLHERC
ncbi:hypothetical protein AABB24_007736 [Solanum stoloniferum]|uniref:Uncharacterized protein n=2 Tax=Solanum stoloniferum TaxID=62892 RepID=A0ABD2UPT5_9SOLN